MGFSRKNKTTLLVAILVVVLLVFQLTSLDDVFRNRALKALSPIKSFFWNSGLRLESRGYDSQLSDLEIENRKLISKIIELENIERENRLLREVIDSGAAQNLSLEMVKVAGRGTNDGYIIINKGLDCGIKENMPVISSGSALVGKTVKVLDSFSYVRLLTHDDSSFEAQIHKKDDALGVVRGGDQLILDLVPRDIEIEIGDIVTSLSMSGVYPEGMIVGKIIEVLRDDAEPYQRALIKPEARVSDLRNLFVVTDF